MRAVQHAAEKVCSNREERSAFIKLGSLVIQEQSEENVQKIFSVLAGELQVNNLPERLQQCLPESTFLVDTKKWKLAKNWVDWWTRPLHLSESQFYCAKTNSVIILILCMIQFNVRIISGIYHESNPM